jgi:hypothetical protein
MKTEDLTLSITHNGYALIAPRSSNHEQIINQIKEATA